VRQFYFLSALFTVDKAGCLSQVTVMPDPGLRELLVALAKRADVRDVLVEAGSLLSALF